MNDSQSSATGDTCASPYEPSPILPFRAWRYDPARVGGLEKVVLRDPITPSVRESALARSPYNLAHVALGRTFSDDDESNNRFTRGRETLGEWIRDGVLVRDATPTITLIEESRPADDPDPDDSDPPDDPAGPWLRRALLVAVELVPYGEGRVSPHEATFPQVKADYRRLLTATEVNVAPPLLLYSLPGDEIVRSWCVSGASEEGRDGSPARSRLAADFVDAEGIRTKVFVSAAPGLLGETIRLLSSLPLLIADGHHRYEASLEYAEWRSDRGDDDGPWNYIPAYLVNTADEGLSLIGTHRLVRNAPPELVSRLLSALGTHFEVTRLADRGAPASSDLDCFMQECRGDVGALGLYAPALGGAFGLRLRDKGVVEAAVPGRSSTYQELDVTVLHKLVLEPLLAIEPGATVGSANVDFTNSVEEAFGRVDRGECQLCFYLRPARVSQVRSLAFAGETMPPKSTCFSPKPPQGIALLDLSDAWAGDQAEATPEDV